VVVPTFLVPATQKVWADVYGQPLPDCGGLTAAQARRLAPAVPAAGQPHMRFGERGRVLPAAARLAAAADPRALACVTGIRGGSTGLQQ